MKNSENKEIVKLSNIEWNYDSIDNNINRALPNQLWVSVEDIEDYITDEYTGDSDEICNDVLIHYLNDNFLTEPNSLTYEYTDEEVRDEDQLIREIIWNGGDISEVCNSYEQLLNIDDVNDLEYEFVENIITNEEACVVIDKYYELWCNTENQNYIEEGVIELVKIIKK